MKRFFPLSLLLYLSLTAFFPTHSKTQFQKSMLSGLNEIRSAGCQCGDTYMPPVKPVKWNPLLALAAQSHASDLDTHHFIGHVGTDGSSIGDRVSKAGYAWQAVGENVIWNASTVAGALAGWQDSPSHCKTMMAASFKEMGAAHKGRYMVQVFGREW